jgi:hypothetical protein
MTATYILLKNCDHFRASALIITKKNKFWSFQILNSILLSWFHLCILFLVYYFALDFTLKILTLQYYISLVFIWQYFYSVFQILILITLSASLKTLYYMKATEKSFTHTKKKITITLTIASKEIKFLLTT